MARKANKTAPALQGKLEDTAIRGRLKDGWYGDGAGLYLQVRNGGKGRSWIMRYKIGGRTRMMGLGSQREISLSAARQLVRDNHAAIVAGGDPLAARRERVEAARIEAAKVVTFKQAAERLIKSKAAEWKNEKHAAQWTATLETYAFPILGKIPVQEVDTGLVMKVLEPIWTAKTETATRVRQRIESVLDWAKAHGYRNGENAARWKGHLDKLLAKPSKVRKVKHFEAMPYAEVPALFTTLKTKTTPSARALRWLIMGATRTGETLLADYSEINFKDGTWTIPAERMKSDRPHVVPLTDEMLALIDREGKGIIFPSAETGAVMSDATLLKYLRDVTGNESVTVHGMRSAFKDWCRERTNFADEVSEAALAHVEKDKTKAAYARSDLLNKRRKLAEAWAGFCNTPSSAGEKIVPIRGV
jgi:integrase